MGLTLAMDAGSLITTEPSDTLVPQLMVLVHWTLGINVFRLLIPMHCVETFVQFGLVLALRVLTNQMHSYNCLKPEHVTQQRMWTDFNFTGLVLGFIVQKAL